MIEVLLVLALIPFAAFGAWFCCAALKAWWPTLKVLAYIAGAIALVPLTLVAAWCLALGIHSLFH